MAGSVPLFYGVVISAIVVIAFLVHRSLRRPADRSRRLRVGRTDAVHSLFAAARRRALLALGIAIMVFIAALLLATARPDWYGLPIFLAPALAGAAGLTFYAATPPHVPAVGDGAVREAALERRSLRSAVPRGWAWAFSTVLVVFILTVVATGLAGADDTRSLAFATANSTSSSSPFPGWFYGAPALAGACVIAVALVFALLRVSSTPALPRAEFAVFDGAWRRVSNRVLLASGTATVSVLLGLTAVAAGFTMRNSAWSFTVDRASGPVRLDSATPLGLEAAPSTWMTTGLAVGVVGVVILVGAVVLIVLSASWAVSFSSEAAHLAQRARSRCDRADRLAPSVGWSARTGRA